MTQECSRVNGDVVSKSKLEYLSDDKPSSIRTCRIWATLFAALLGSNCFLVYHMYRTQRDLDRLELKMDLLQRTMLLSGELPSTDTETFPASTFEMDEVDGNFDLDIDPGNVSHTDAGSTGAGIGREAKDVARSRTKRGNRANEASNVTSKSSGVSSNKNANSKRKKVRLCMQQHALLVM